MGVFIIFRVTEPAKLKEAIKASFGVEQYDLGNNEWLVSLKGTPKEVSDKIGISDGSNGNAMIFAMSGYYGRATTEIWDWIKAKAEATDV